jgi:hypothetical protein
MEKTFMVHDGKTVVVTLTNKKGESAECIVDADAWVSILQYYKWYLQTSRSKKYAITTICVGKKRSCMSMHTLLLPKQPFQVVDHINGNGLDNRRENLRRATPAQNATNRKHGKSYRGVCLMEGKYYYASICSNRKTYHLGSFKTPEEAAKAYNEAAVKFHGEFARLNNV